MKRIVIALLVAVSSLAHAWEQRAPLALPSCQIHSPYGFAQTKKTLTSICRQGYLSAYDAAAKIPAYVAYTLTPPNALGCIARTNAFAADKSVQAGATPADYAGAGFDKGHMSPDGDLSWDQQVEYESFLMTNMTPQAPSLNRGIWKLLETNVRGWAVELNQTYTIYVGAVYDAKDKKIGNGVVVPHALYKIVVNNQTKEVAGWLFPHVSPYPNLGNDLTKFRLPIAQIQQQGGVTFKYPAGAKELQPGKEWAMDFGDLTQAKRNKCGANASDD